MNQVKGSQGFINCAVPLFGLTLVVALLFILFLASQPKSSGKIYTSRSDHASNYNTLAAVTRKCYFDIKIDGKPKGRIIIGLFGDVVPITSRNFAELCSGVNGYSNHTGWNLSYQGTKFHRIIKDFMAQGGDISPKRNGLGSQSIYETGLFPDESFRLRHSKPYLLSMANSGPDTNGSQFFIIFRPTPWLDGQNVVFGEVIGGLGIVRQIMDLGTKDGNDVEKTVEIGESGELPM